MKRTELRMPALRGGFTLVEMLVVLAIISVLSGLVTVSVQFARAQANEKRTRIEIQNLEAAILSYRNQFGDFPPSSLANTIKGFKPNGTNDGNESLVIHLSTGKKGGPFHAEFDDTRLENYDGDKMSTKQQSAIRSELDLAWETPNLWEYCDYWGNPFVYIHHRDYKQKKKAAYQGYNKQRVFVEPAKSEKTGTYQKPTTFQIWSFGPNGINENGGGDDITSFGE